MAATAIDSLRGILNGFRDLNSKGIYTMNATETDLLRQILLEVQALSLGNIPADDSVTTPKIVDLNVTTAKLADNSVATAKIINANVTPAKLSQPLTFGSPISKVASKETDPETKKDTLNALVLKMPLAAHVFVVRSISVNVIEPCNRFEALEIKIGKVVEIFDPTVTIPFSRLEDAPK